MDSIFKHMHRKNSERKGDARCSGQLSHEDIRREIESKRLVISSSAHTSDKLYNVKQASFDITPSCLVMSVKRGRFVKIYSNISHCEMGHRIPEWRCRKCPRKKRSDGLPPCPEQKYIYIEPRDTVLVLSKEYLQLPGNIAGNVFSRVSTVSSGLGHISTTIDPYWRGALLIAISNPSSEPIKLVIEDANSTSVPLATVTLQYLNTPSSKESDLTTHLPARVDILEKYLYNIEDTKSRRVLLRKSASRFIHMNDYNLTVRLIDRLKKMSNIEPDKWPEKLNEMEREVYAQKTRERKLFKIVLCLLNMLRMLLPVAIAFTLAALVYQAVSGDAVSASDFIAPFVIALAEIVVTIISGSRR